MVVESVGEHTVKFDDKALMDGIVQMLKGNRSKSVWVTVTHPFVLSYLPETQESLLLGFKKHFIQASKNTSSIKKKTFADSSCSSQVLCRCIFGGNYFSQLYVKFMNLQFLMMSHHKSTMQDFSGLFTKTIRKSTLCLKHFTKS